VKHLLIAFPVFLALVSACSIGDIAGSKGGSETTNGICACVMNSDGTPAAGSLVRLRQADYVSSPALAKQAIKSKEVLTDSLGRFLITDLDHGDYCVEVNDTVSLSGVTVFNCTIATDDDTLDLGTDSLHPYAVLKGHVDSDGTGEQKLFVQVKGLERLVQVDQNGSFMINDLPEGYLDLIVCDGVKAGTERELLNLKTIPEDTLTVNISGKAVYSEFLYLNTSAADLKGFSITGFPVLVRFDDSSFDFDKADPDGDDIRFAKADGKSLPFEIEQWDPKSGRATIWVKIDTISGSSTEQRILLKWGGSAAVKKSNGAAVFDTALGFVGVWHLNEDPSTGEGCILDRTGNGYNGTSSSSMSSESVVRGMVGDGLVFDGVSDNINAGMLNLDGNYTLSCWVKAEKGLCPNWRFIIKESSYTLWYNARWRGFQAEHFVDTFVWRGIFKDSYDSVPCPMTLETWYYITSTFDGDRVRLYVNGEIVDTSKSIGMNPRSNNVNPLMLGGRYYEDEISEFFKGTMDEIRIERAARSAEWIKLCYLNQRAESDIVRFGGK